MRRIPQPPWGMLLPAIFLLLLAGLAPFIDAGITSFFHDLYGERWFAGLENYRFFSQDRAFGYSLNITVGWAVVNTALVLILAFFLASFLVLETRRWARRLIFGSLLIPWAVPVYILVPIWRALIHGNGGTSLLTRLFGIEANLMTDPAAGFLGSLFVSVWMGLPIAVFVFTGALKKIPKSVIDAANLDGTDRFDLVRYIFFPSIRRSLLVIAVLNFVKSFKEFTLIFMMTAGGPPLISGITERYIVGSTTTLGIFLYDLFNETDDFGIVSAYSIVMAGLVVLVMILWFFLRNREKRIRLRVIFAAVVQPLFLGFPGLVISALLLGGLKRRLYFFSGFLLQTAWLGYRVLTEGFLEGSSPAIIFTLFVLLSLPRRGRIKLFSKLRGTSKNIATSKQTRRAGAPRAPWGSPVFSTLRRRAPALGFDLLRYLLPAVMLISGVLVLYMLLWMSFSGISLAYADTFIPPYFTAESYATVVEEENILRYFGNTIIVAGLTSLIIPFVGFTAAVFLVSRGKGFTHGFLTLVQVLSIAGGMHSLIPLFSIFRRLGLVNSFTPLVLIYLYHAIPFSLFTITAYLEQLPRSLGDQAKIEGVSPLRYTASILFPLSLPVITTSVMTAFLGAWNGFMAPLLFLNNDAKYTISVKLFSFAGSIGSANPKWNLFAAASVINCAIVVGLFSWFRRPVLTTALSDAEDN